MATDMTSVSVLLLLLIAVAAAILKKVTEILVEETYPMWGNSIGLWLVRIADRLESNEGEFRAEYLAWQDTDEPVPLLFAVGAVTTAIPAALCRLRRPTLINGNPNEDPREWVVLDGGFAIVGGALLLIAALATTGINAGLVAVATSVGLVGFLSARYFNRAKSRISRIFLAVVVVSVAAGVAGSAVSDASTGAAAAAVTFAVTSSRVAVAALLAFYPKTAGKG